MSKEHNEILDDETLFKEIVKQGKQLDKEIEEMCKQIFEEHTKKEQ